MSIATQAFFWFPFAWNTFFHPLTFTLYVSLKWVFCRHLIYGCWFCIPSASLCLLVGALYSVTFKVTTDMNILTAILLIVLDLFLKVFFSSLLLLLSSLLISIFSDMCGFFFFFVYLITCRFLVPMKFLELCLLSIPCVCVCVHCPVVSDSLRLHFKKYVQDVNIWWLGKSKDIFSLGS